MPPVRHGERHQGNFQQRDLKISHQQYIGWSVTEPTEKLKSTIKEYHLDSPIEYVRMGGYTGTGGNDGGDGNDDLNGAGGTDGRPPKKKSSTRKYLCPGCHNSVRATKDVNIMCMDCSLQMVKQE